MSSEEQKALLKKVYDKNKGRIDSSLLIPAPVGMQVKRKKGESDKEYRARMKEFVKERDAKRKKAVLKKFQGELSKGSDKKLENLPEKNRKRPIGEPTRMRAGGPKPEKKKTTQA